MPGCATNLGLFQFLTWGFFPEQRVDINLTSKPQWEQAYGWSLSRNGVTIDIIICHVIPLFVTVFFVNTEPHLRWRSFVYFFLG